MATKKKNDQYDIILNKLGFDANNLIVKITNRTKYYQKILLLLGLLNIYSNLLKHGKKDISSLKQYILD